MALVKKMPSIIEGGSPARPSGSEFRQALGFFPTGVAIITAMAPDGERLGVTVSSFNSVSLDPPLVLFSLARGLASFEAWQSVRCFAVNLLGEEQHALSSQFAKARSDKWQGVRVTTGLSGAPLLKDAPAGFECDFYARYDGGDHEIIVGRVLALRTATREQKPLIFYRSKYHQLDVGQTHPASDQAVAWLHGW